jgi:glycosyltransferase involved in cell wall biosynthesis
MPVPSTEISIIRPFSYLEDQQELTWKLVKEASFHPDLLDQVDIVVFHRNCHPNGRAILDRVKATQIPVIYELDDNYFAIPEDLPIGRYMRNPYVVQTLESFLSSANIVKIGSPELTPIVSRYNQNIICQPYAVDLTILNNITPRQNNHFTIGYAGTIYHHHDFKFVIEAMRRITEVYPQVHWDFIGCLPESAKSLPKITFTPFISSYSTFLENLYWRHWRIGLCPILDLPHNRCKTDNKLREYSACQIPGVYSDIPPYSTNVQQGETGLLAENTEHAWFDAMKALIDNEALRNKIAAQARKWVEEQRSIPIIAKLWLELFHQLLK